MMGVVFFAFQLYVDFSAYSEIAIGAARMLGFKLSTNFRRPYFSKSFSEFWTRWHITLSSWFRDYVYIPLGGNRKGKSRKIMNTMIVFMLSGLWHGASWNFVIWGTLNGLFVIALDDLFRMKTATGLRRALNSLFVFCAWTLSLIFFRAETFSSALEVFKNIGFGGMDKLYDFGLNSMEYRFSLILLLLLMIYEFAREKVKNISERFFNNTPLLIRVSVYVLLALVIIYLGVYGSSNDNRFIYFQF
jgi:D-alanyl-lipoteichoic acid acyltransferase DltB (MBOAT superfamily)